MNLDRNILIDYSSKSQSVKFSFVLGKVSDLTNDYLLLNYDTLDGKAIANDLSDFIANSTISLISQSEMLKMYKADTDHFLSNSKDFDIFTEIKKVIGAEYLYKLKSYYVVGILNYRYAQIDIPRPILFNPENLINDFRALISSRFSLEEILQKLNKYYKDKKYINQMALPLVDVFDKDNEFLTENVPPKSDIEVKTEFSLLESSQQGIPAKIENVFTDTLLARRGNQIPAINSLSEEVSDALNKLIVVVNNKINQKLGLDDEFDFLSEIENIDLEFDELETIEL